MESINSNLQTDDVNYLRVRLEIEIFYHFFLCEIEIFTNPLNS